MANSFVFGTFLLVVGSVISKAIGALYKIPLTNIIGSQGMGLYYLVFPIFSLCLVLSTSGVSVALSRLVSRCNNSALRYRQGTYFKCALLISLFISLLLGAGLVVLSKHIAFLQGNNHLTWAYIYIIPAIVLASICGIVKSYFQGLGDMKPTTASMIVEQVAKLIFGLIFASKFAKFGVVYGVYGAIFGVVISELFTFVFLAVVFMVKKHKYNYNFDCIVKSNMYVKASANFSNLSLHHNRKLSVYFKEIFGLSVAYTSTNLVIPIMALLDSLFIVKLLCGSGMQLDIATRLYGIQNGVVATLIALPNLICLSISTAIVPDLSKLSSKNETAINKKIRFYVIFTIVSVIPFVLIFLINGDSIINVLYAGGLTKTSIDEFNFAYTMLRVSCIQILYVALMQVSTAILHALGHKKMPLYAMIISFVVREIALIVFIKYTDFGIYSVSVADTIFVGVCSTICVVHIIKLTHVNFATKTLCGIVFATAFSGTIAVLLKHVIYMHMSNIVYVVVSSVLLLFVYAIFIVLLNVFDSKKNIFAQLKSIMYKSKQISE